MISCEWHVKPKRKKLNSFCVCICVRLCVICICVIADGKTCPCMSVALLFTNGSNTIEVERAEWCLLLSVIYRRNKETSK